MGRLIDADAFEKFIREKYEDGESTDDIKDQMLFDLSYQPTAYDISKVVAELESKRDYRELTNYYGDVIGVRNIDTIKIDKAIDIVRKGGISEPTENEEAEAK